MTPEEVRDLLLRDRSKRDKQVNIGPSEIGGCERKIWHRIQRTIPTNLDTLSLAARMGTAFHKMIEDKLALYPRYMLETRVERDGIVGHVDCYDTHTQQIIDWKTTKLRGLPYFPSKQQRWQVQVYGWLMESLYPVESVCLVAFPRDGTDRDIVVHEETYDPAIAMEALDSLAAVYERQTPPRPERKKSFCRDYCQYYDPSGVIGCPSS